VAVARREAAARAGPRRQQQEEWEEQEGARTMCRWAAWAAAAETSVPAPPTCARPWSKASPPCRRCRASSLISLHHARSPPPPSSGCHVCCVRWDAATRALTSRATTSRNRCRSRESPTAHTPPTSPGNSSSSVAVTPSPAVLRPEPGSATHGRSRAWPASTATPPITAAHPSPSLIVRLHSERGGVWSVQLLRHASACPSIWLLAGSRSSVQPPVAAT
jgi:hypothetical protein